MYILEVTGNQERVRLVGAYQLMGYVVVVVVVIVVVVVVIVIVVVVVVEKIHWNTKMPLDSVKVLVCK